MHHSSIPVDQLISAVSRALPNSEHCVLTPDKRIEHALGHGMSSIACYTGELDHDSNTRVLSHFVSQKLRCVGYSSGNQYVVHQLVGGGPLASCDLWVSRDRLADHDFRVQIFQQASSSTGVALFYRTVYLSTDTTSESEHPDAPRPLVADTHKLAVN